MQIATEEPRYFAYWAVCEHCCFFVHISAFFKLAPPLLLYIKSSHLPRSLSPSSPVNLLSFWVFAFVAHSFPPSRSRIAKLQLPPLARASGGTPSTVTTQKDQHTKSPCTSKSRKVQTISYCAKELGLSRTTGRGTRRNRKPRKCV